MNNKLFWSLAFLIVSGVVFGITIRNFVGNSSYNQTAALNLAVSTTSLSVGDKVVTISDAEVKKNPNTSTVSGTQTKGSSGVVTGIYGTRSKTNVKSEIWINVDYDSGVDGWTMEGKLEKKDEIPPTLVMLSPKGNISVSGTVHFKLDVSDNRGIDHVDFIIDGVTVKTLTQAPYEIYVGGSDPSAVPYPNTSKTHKFAARAVDTSGNATDVDPIVTLISPVPVREGGVTYIKFTFGIADNYSYIVEKTTSLTSPINWVDVNTLPVAERGRTTDNGDGTLSYLAPAVGTMGFFRVRATELASTPTLVVSRNGEGKVTSDRGGIDCGAICSTDYVHAAAVTLSAFPETGSVFTGWSAPCSGFSICNVYLASGNTVNITATFTPIPASYTLTVIKSGSGQGTVTSVTPNGSINCGSTCSFSFPTNSSVILHAEESVNSIFNGWSGPCSGTADCVVLMDQVRNVTATFFSASNNEDVVLAPGENFCTKYKNQIATFTNTKWIINQATVTSLLLPESDEERLNLEYVNRARMNPTAEAARMRDSTDPLLLADIQRTGENMNTIYNEISALAVTQPVAGNRILRAASQKHACDQALNNFQGHIGSDGSNPDSRLTAAGYAWNTFGENANAFAQSVFHGHAGFEIDWGYPSRTHRTNIHGGNFREAGMAIVKGGLVAPYRDMLLNEEYGNRWGLTPYITGVVYFDINGNNFYDIGEGIGGVRVSGGAVSTVTERSGGYALQVQTNGDYDYTVTFTSNTPGVLVPGSNTKNVTVTGGLNSKLDYTPTYISPFISGPSSLPANTSGSFSFARVPFATGYELEASTINSTPALEGAESPRGMGNTRLVDQDNTIPTYPAIVSDVKATGNSSFHIVMPSAKDYILEMTKPFTLRSGAILQFKSCFGWATASQIFKVQASKDDGVTWTNLHSQIGDSTQGEYDQPGGICPFTRRDLSIPFPAESQTRLRFIYDNIGQSYYYQTSKGMGVYIDDIQVINADELVGSAISTIPNGSLFNWSSPTPGTAILRLRGAIGQRKFPFSAIKTVNITESANLLKNIFLPLKKQ